MNSVLRSLFILCLLPLPAVAEEQVPVPVEKASYHWPVFRNDQVMVLRVHFLPGQTTNFHIHSLDQISVVITGGGNTNEIYGQPPGQPKAKGEGEGKAKGKGRVAATFTAYSKKALIHRSTNNGTTPFLNIVVALVQPKPGTFSPQPREVAGYTQLFDNERARAWELMLQAGETAGVIHQTAPGMRIALDRGEIAEIVSGARDRALVLNPGDFYWQDPNATRAVRNTGTTPIRLIEFELK
jgi:quercetin dioxygenase-like cupin family protein